MARRRIQEPEKDNSDRWLLTYADLITLLMIFFVVMYSMSRVDAEKFQNVAESLSMTLGGSDPAIIEMAPVDESILDRGDNSNSTGNSLGDGSSELENMTIEGIKQKLDRFALDNGIETKLISSIEERGLVVSIQDTLLFESGSSDTTPKAEEILDKITNVLATAPNYIKVEGHTDNLPINTERFPSNWELSVLRATNVVHIMAQEISSDRLSATGYGEHRPVADNSIEEGRARNRRVDLIILRSKYDVTEPGEHQLGGESLGATTQE